VNVPGKVSWTPGARQSRACIGTCCRLTLPGAVTTEHPEIKLCSETHYLEITHGRMTWTALKECVSGFEVVARETSSVNRTVVLSI